MKARIAVTACLVALAFALGACGGGAAPAATTQPELRDPAAPGPYGVGLTKLTFERPANADGAPRKLETWIWYPATGAAGDRTSVAEAPPATGGAPFPIVVFSHGSGGQPNFYTYFTQHLASWGFVVVAPPHPGDTSADCFPCSGASIIASARERPTDVTFVLDQVIALKDDASQPIGKIVDPTRTAIAGHSFGGWTAIFAGTSGRFGAIVSMAPGVPSTLMGSAPGIRVPVLLLGGAKDELVNPKDVAALYAALPSDIPKTYVSFPEGHHLTFSDRCLGCTEALSEARGHELVNRYATAFLETYVMRDDRYARFLREDVAPDALIVQDP